MRLGSTRGLTMIECVVASVVLLIVWIAVSGTLMLSQRVQVEAGSRAAAELAVTNLAVRLRALPFADRDVAGPAPANDVLDLVFPHAQPTSNTADASFQVQASGDQAAGSFVTTAHIGHVTLRSIACFVDSTSRGWRPVAVTQVEGLCFRDGEPPPAPALAITITATWSRQGRLCSVARRLVIVESSSPTPAATEVAPA